MNSVSINKILKLLDLEDISFQYQGSMDIVLQSPSSIDELDNYSLSFLNSLEVNKYLDLIKPNNLIILKSELYSFKLPEANYLFVENPSLCFNIVAWLFKDEKFDIHPTAIIDKTAILGDNISIGANSIIGPGVIIGNRTKIEENCVIKNTNIGENTIIQSGVKTGHMGFGSYLHPNGKWFDFPHFGLVIIGDNVFIQNNVVINRGTLNNTVIEKNVRIGPLSLIAHGVIVEKSCFISQSVTIAGSVKIKEKSTLWGSVSVADGKTIGSNCVIAMGAVVTKDVPDNETWAGVPAMKFQNFLNIQKKLKS